jgi:phosphoglycolate phosphatase
MRLACRGFRGNPSTPAGSPGAPRCRRFATVLAPTTALFYRGPVTTGRFDAVLFDLDGTLVDSLEDLADSANTMLVRLGYPEHPVPAYRHFVGDGVAMLAERVLPPEARTPQGIAEAVEQLRAAYSENWNRRTRLYDGVAEMLEDIVASGAAIGVLSNKPHEMTQRVVAHLLTSWPWAVVLGARDGVPRKPHPAAALEAAAVLGVPPACVLYLGDTATDMATARAAGMFPVGALWGFRDERELREAGATVLASSPCEVVRVLTAGTG